MIIASGSEVEPSIAAQKLLSDKGVDARVISMPSIEVFEAQPKTYRESVIPASVQARVCVEAGSSYSWHKFAGIHGQIIGMDEFGVSGKYPQLFEKYGFTAQNIAQKALESINLAK